jgi:hypothetical protein
VGLGNDDPARLPAAAHRRRLRLDPRARERGRPQRPARETALGAEERADGRPDAQSAAAERRIIDLLIENLGDRDPSVRFFTAIALRKLTNRDFGYEAYGDADERDAAIQRWEDWAAEGRPRSGTRGDGHGDNERQAAVIEARRSEER